MLQSVRLQHSVGIIISILLLLLPLQGVISVELSLLETIAVATHRLPKPLTESLPSVEQLEMEMEAAIAEIGGAQGESEESS